MSSSFSYRNGLIRFCEDKTKDREEELGGFGTHASSRSQEVVTTDVEELLEYLDVVARSVFANLSICALFEVPKWSATSVCPKLMVLNGLVTHLIRPEQRNPRLILKLLSDIGGCFDVFPSIVAASVLPGPQAALYKHFRFELTETDQSSLLIDMRIGCESFSRRLATLSFIRRPRLLWIELHRTNEDCIVIPERNVLLSCTAKGKLNYQLKMAICKGQGTWSTILMEGMNWIGIDGSGTRTLISNKLEAIGAIYSTSIVLVYETLELKFSENYSPKAEPASRSDLQIFRSNVENSDEDEGSRSVGSLLSDDEHERKHSGEEKGRKRASNSTPLPPLQTPPVLDKFDFLFEKIRKLCSSVNRNMRPEEFKILSKIPLIRKGLKFRFQKESYTATMKEDNAGLAVGIQLVRHSHKSDTTYYLCRACLRPSPSSTYLYFCLEHADEHVCFSVILVTSGATDGHRLSVMKMHAVHEERTRKLTLLKSEAVRVLGKSMNSKADFLINFHLEEASLMTFRNRKDARSYLLALQAWNWINFKILLQRKDKYFSNRAIGIGSDVPLYDCDVEQTRGHLLQIARSNHLVLNLSYSAAQPMTMEEQRRYKFRAFLDRASCFNRPAKLRSTIYSMTYNIHQLIYYGRSGPSSPVISYYHSSLQARVKNKTLYELDTSDTPSKIGEGCFSTKDIDTASVLESVIQLIGMIGQTFQLTHSVHNCSLRLINCGVLAVNDIRNPNNDRYDIVFNKLLQLEYQHKLGFVREDRLGKE